MHDPEFKHYNIMEEKKNLYSYILDDVTSGGVNIKEDMYKKYGLEPIEYGPFDVVETEEEGEGD